MKMLVVSLLISGAVWAQESDLKVRPTLGNKTNPAVKPEPGRPVDRKVKGDMAKFADLYKCEDEWMKVDGRPNFRTLACNSEAKLNGKSCESNSKLICIGTTKCQPRNENIAKELESEKTDPQYLFTQFEYTAACTTDDAFSCKKPTDCVAEDIEKSLWVVRAGWEGHRRNLLRKRVSQ